MLIQSLVLIAAMVVLSGAILTSTLVTAKASLHHTLLAKTQTAMNDATAAFVTAAALHVRKYGTEQPWPRSTPSSEPLCNSASLSASPCPFLSVASWRVTGRTRGTASFPSKVAALSDAENLAATIDEQRISATVAVRVTDPTGKILFADRSRQITARLFNASPYVVVTGSRDSTSAAGSVRASEGDTGGAPPSKLDPYYDREYPIERHPARFTDTRVRTSINCTNSSTSFDQSHPFSSGDAGSYINRSIRTFGNQDWAFEAPCEPRYLVDDAAAPSGYATPIGNVYVANPTQPNSKWEKGGSNGSTFAR